MAFAGATQASAQPAKAPMRSAIFSSIPSGFQQLGNTSIYYNVSQRYAAAAAYQTGFSILGEIDGQYYSSTYEASGEGAGFIAGFQVNNGTPAYLNAATGTTISGVTCTADIVPQGDVAARIVYTLTNTNSQAVTVNAGVWGDIMIGNNDRAPLERMTNSQQATYGIKMKYNTSEDSPLLCALFGEGITGVTAADDYWFGYFCNNYLASDIVGNYDNILDWSFYAGDVDQYYMVENSTAYDCGLGFCWKNREIPAGESIELSYLVSVGEVDFEEPIIPDPEPEPGEDIFTYNVAAIDFAGWNDLSVAHPAHAWGHYEHPYGQSGYLEYQVDDENTWHAMGELVSGQDYDLDFDMMFNADRTTDHVLRVRFTLGLGEYADMDGLTWTDVRSYNVEGIENRVYNGQPQVFEVTINGATETYVGETVPGTYSFTIEGEFDNNTIAVKEVPYIIDKAQAVVNVVVPENVKYDGQPHGATVTVTVGDNTYSVTYINQATPNQPGSSTAPSQVGKYIVVVEVYESEYYYGIEPTAYGQFEIYTDNTAVEEISAQGEDNGVWYTIDGRRVAAPTERGIYIKGGKKYVVK